MKRLAIVLIGAWSLSGCHSLSAKTETLTGQVIDLYCYTMNRSDVGMDHRSGRECAWACVRYEGQPAGLLTADGKAYQFVGPVVANNNEKIARHLTHTVTVTGTIGDLDGMPTISASDVTDTK